MATIGSLGTFRGFGNTSIYGCFYVYLDYTSSGTTVSPTAVRLVKDVSGKYTTNTAYLDYVQINGVGVTLVDTSKGMSGCKTAGDTLTFRLSGSVNAGGTSASVTIGIHRSSAGTQVFNGTISGLATVPTGCWVSVSSRTETRVTLSGGYSSDGGTGITSSGYQYRTSSSGWMSFSNGSTNLSPGTSYWFRYYAGNSVGTSYSGETSTTTYNYPSINSKPAFTIGNNFTIGVTSPRGLSCTVYIIAANGSSKSMGSNSGGNLTVGSAAEWKNFFYQSIPSAQSGSYKVRLVCSSVSRDTTENGSTYSIRGDEYPTFPDSSVTDVKDTLHTDITGNSAKIISGHNTLTGTIKPMTTSYYASLSSYSVVCGDKSTSKTYSSSNQSFSLSNVTSSVLTVTAIDGRNKTQARSKNLTIIPYTKPNLTVSNITRQNGTGNYAIFDLQGTYQDWASYSLTKNNTISTIKYRYKKQGTDSWSSWTAFTSKTVSGGVWKVNQMLTTSFSNTDRYDVEVQVVDLLETVTFSGLIISTANALIWKDLKNKRVGIGKKPDYNLDVQGSIGATDAIYLHGTKILWWE